MRVGKKRKVEGDGIRELLSAKEALTTNTNEALGGKSLGLIEKFENFNNLAGTMIALLIEQGIALLQEYPFLAVFALFLAGMLVYYQLVVIKPVVLNVKPNSRYEFFLKRTLPILSELYWPTFWCFESRLQTVLASMVRSTLPDIIYRREVLMLSDGGEVCLDWIDNGHKDGSKEPIVLFLPGLTGDSQSEYIKSFVNVARMKLGARCVVFNNRGRGGHTLKTPRTYCASKTDDLVAVIDHIKAKNPNASLMALGVSLGGIILGNYLTTHKEEVKGKIVAAMLVSICWDTFEGTLSLEKKGINLMLNRHLANCLTNSIKEVRHHFDKSGWDLDSILSSKTIKEFDDRFTSRQFGYSDVKEYYTDACLAGKLQNMKIPVLALNAEDDPFQPGDSIPKEEASTTDNIAIITTAYGGHIGFMEGILPTRYHFSDRLFEQFATGVFKNEPILATI